MMYLAKKKTRSNNYGSLLIENSDDAVGTKVDAGEESKHVQTRSNS